MATSDVQPSERLMPLIIIGPISKVPLKTRSACPKLSTFYIFYKDFQLGLKNHWKVRLKKFDFSNFLKESTQLIIREILLNLINNGEIYV